MSATYLSSINKTESGTITVPANCTAVYALQKGSIIPPVIAGVDMSAVAAVEATLVIPAVGIFEYRTPAIAELAFTFTGVYVEFIFLSGSDGFRPGGVFGYNSGGVLTGEQPTSTADLVLGILCGSIGPTVLKGDGVAMTYLVNTAVDKAGFLSPGDSLLTCLAQDTGSSAGYWIDNGVIHHPQVKLTDAYFDYPATWNPGYWNYVPMVHPGHWEWLGGTQRWVPEWVETQTIYVPGYWSYPQTFHPATYQDAYDEDIPDTWVPAGTSQLSAVFVSIKISLGGGFVSRPHIYQ